MAESIETLINSLPLLRQRLRLFRAKGTLQLLPALCLVAAFIVCVPMCRTHILTLAGHVLVVDQSATSADIIVVAIDADGAGTLEAADLVRKGVATKVAVFDDPPSPVDREFLHRGLPYEDRAATSIRQLHSLGVASVEQISRATTGSEQEGYILPAWCKQRGYRSVVLVTSADHSRRLRRIFRRSLHSHDLAVVVQGSPYSEFDPNDWWRSREGIRTGIEEFEKLMLDIVRHPFS